MLLNIQSIEISQVTCCNFLLTSKEVAPIMAEYWQAKTTYYNMSNGDTGEVILTY